MKNKFYLVISIMFLCASLSACKFNLGGNTTSDSGSSNSTNRSTAKSDSANKTTTKAKPNAEKSDSRKSGDDSAAIADTSDEESNDSDAETNDSGEYDLEIGRTFQVGEKPDGPPQHGDYTVIKELESGGTMGSLHVFKPREAIFILSDGEVIAGPLTTVEQIEEAYAILSNQSASGYETRMNIMKNYPTGGKKRVRVYDSKGNYIREEYEP
jgi:hypothetical protein